MGVLDAKIAVITGAAGRQGRVETRLFAEEGACVARYAARDLAGYGIRVNAVFPGAVNVSMIKGADSDASRAAVAAKTPLQRVGAAEEIAPTVLFLASDASSYLTGAELVVDGA